MNPRPPTSTRTATLVPYTTHFRALEAAYERARGAEEGRLHSWLRAAGGSQQAQPPHRAQVLRRRAGHPRDRPCVDPGPPGLFGHQRSEEHTSELQSLMRISYAVFCLKKKKQNKYTNDIAQTAHIIMTEKY